MPLAHEFFSSQICPHLAFSNSSITVLVFSPRYWFLALVPTAVSAHESLLSGKVRPAIFAGLSFHSQGSSLPCVLPSLKDPRKVVNFSICLAFYLLLRQSGDFQASYLQKMKTGSLQHPLYM